MRQSLSCETRGTSYHKSLRHLRRGRPRRPVELWNTQLTTAKVVVRRIDAGSGLPVLAEAEVLDAVFTKDKAFPVPCLLEALDRAGIPHGPLEQRYGATGNGASVYAQDPDGRTVELKLVGSPADP